MILASFGTHILNNGNMVLATLLNTNSEKVIARFPLATKILMDIHLALGSAN